MNAPEASPLCHRLEALPFDNHFARLPDLHYTRLTPWPLPAPHLVAASESAAALIGLDPAEFAHPDFAEHFAGNRLPTGAEPLAAVSSGHLFGEWAGQLGDGRALLLGEVAGWDIQLKGAGRICNRSDTAGRYAYRRQPPVTHWKRRPSAAPGRGISPSCGESSPAWPGPPPPDWPDGLAVSCSSRGDRVAAVV